MSTPFKPTAIKDPDSDEQKQGCVAAIKAIQPPMPMLQQPLPEQPSVSVLICSYNRLPFLVTLLMQLASQTYEKYEVIVLGELDVSFSLQPPAVGIQFFPSPTKHLGVMRNLAVLLAKGEFLIFIDDDFYITEDFITRHVLLNIQEQGRGAAAVQGHFIGAPYDERGNGWVRRACTFQPNGSHLKILRMGNCFIKRAALESVGGFNMSLRFGEEDTELGQRLHALGHVILNAPEVVSIHLGAATGGTRTEPGEMPRRLAGKIADGGLSRVSLNQPVMGALYICKHLFKNMVHNPSLFLGNFPTLWKESVVYFCQQVRQNLGLARQKHMALTKDQYLHSSEFQKDRDEKSVAFHLM
ncbi:MAG: glycosyltransferase family A protein [Deltaproteobacteria bacterium]|nr:glycosyltransferase family A protein [Deltaproteobacteria bacterium]